MQSNIPIPIKNSGMEYSIQYYDTDRDNIIKNITQYSDTDKKYQYRIYNPLFRYRNIYTGMEYTIHFSDIYLFKYRICQFVSISLFRLCHLPTL